MCEPFYLQGFTAGTKAGTPQVLPLAGPRVCGCAGARTTCPTACSALMILVSVPAALPRVPCPSRWPCDPSAGASCGGSRFPAFNGTRVIGVGLSHTGTTTLHAALVRPTLSPPCTALAATHHHDHDAPHSLPPSTQSCCRRCESDAATRRTTSMRCREACAGSGTSADARGVPRAERLR